MLFELTLYGEESERWIEAVRDLTDVMTIRQ